MLTLFDSECPLCLRSRRLSLLPFLPRRLLDDPLTAVTQHPHPHPPAAMSSTTVRLDTSMCETEKTKGEKRREGRRGG